MNQSNLFHKIRQFIHEHKLLEKGERIVVAVSGGIDSVTMLDLLLRVAETLNLETAVAHFNHGLRGTESDGDEDFVRKLAANRSLACYVERADTASVAEARKLSIQEAARDLRYEFFTSLRALVGFDKIVTAHTADDNAETILFNLLRGSGVQGLSGIPLWRKDISVVRPLLNTSREEIEQYAGERGLQYRTDSTNLHDDYTRNFLRNSIIPRLKEHVNPDVLGTLGRVGEVFRELSQFLTGEARRILDDVLVKNDAVEAILDIGKLSAQPVFMREYLLLLVARDFSTSDIHFSAVKAMLKLCEAETGSSHAFGKDCTVFRDRDKLVFRHSTGTGPFSYQVKPNKEYEFNGFHFSSATVDSAGNLPAAFAVKTNGDRSVEYIDADCLGQNLVVRSWSDGDWFYPLGMKGRKKLSNFFVDTKIPLYDKGNVPVLESDGRIVWICGNRIDNRFRITEKTRRVLKLEFSRTTEE